MEKWTGAGQPAPVWKDLVRKMEKKKQETGPKNPTRKQGACGTGRKCTPHAVAFSVISGPFVCKSYDLLSKFTPRPFLWDPTLSFSPRPLWSRPTFMSSSSLPQAYPRPLLSALRESHFWLRPKSRDPPSFPLTPHVQSASKSCWPNFANMLRSGRFHPLRGCTLLQATIGCQLPRLPDSSPRFALAPLDHGPQHRNQADIVETEVR